VHLDQLPPCLREEGIESVEGALDAAEHDVHLENISQSTE
jgi:hypothetical protein